MEPVVSHLHTYFFFPFSIDRDVVMDSHSHLWQGRPWVEGLDAWIDGYGGQGVKPLGLPAWQRAPYTHFDAGSRAYQDMVFFHPFVRRIFFDTAVAGSSLESLLRFYRIPIGGDRPLSLFASDARGRSAAVRVNDIRLSMFGNGVGVMSIGVEASRLQVREALWINEMMRKIFPSSDRQIREGRTPNLAQLRMGEGEREVVLIEERFENARLIDFHPPLSRIVTGLLYFADYTRGEYDPSLDERMMVYSYLSIDPASVEPDFHLSDEYQKLFSRALYVDRYQPEFRYEEEFTRQQMEQQVYRRWAHQGTLYGFTSYSSLTMAMGEFDCDDHSKAEGFLVHRMFDTRYYLMQSIALFYRATLLEFAERVALLSRRLHLDEVFEQENLELATKFRSEFLIFSNYWLFDELANKDEESEHFRLLMREYRIKAMHDEVQDEIERLNTTLTEYFQRRNTEAVNRLAMLSMILGAGAVITGFFGMNFGSWFGESFFEPRGDPTPVLMNVAILFVTVFALGSLAFGLFLVLRNWKDYRSVLDPASRKRRRNHVGSLKKTG